MRSVKLYSNIKNCLFPSWLEVFPFENDNELGLLAWNITVGEIQIVKYANSLSMAYKSRQYAGLGRGIYICILIVLLQTVSLSVGWK